MKVLFLEQKGQQTQIVTSKEMISPENNKFHTLTVATRLILNKRKRRRYRLELLVMVVTFYTGVKTRHLSDGVSILTITSIQYFTSSH